MQSRVKKWESGPALRIPTTLSWREPTTYFIPGISSVEENTLGELRRVQRSSDSPLLDIFGPP
jgi:hypothetical protein